MPTSFDRLEKLFSRRKDLSMQMDPDMFESQGPRATSFDQSFPQPSFIRPRVSRMKAREERVVASQNEKRAQSLPEVQSERVSIHIAHLSSASTASLALPSRSLSLTKQRDSQPLASLRGFDFPFPPTSLPASPCAMSSSKTLQSTHRVCHEHRHSSVIPPSRADTPPASDQEDDSSIKGSQAGRPSSSLSSDLLTPAASPEMKPVQDKSKDSAELSLAKRKAAAAATRRRREEKAAALRRPQGQSRPHRSITSPSQILKGGDVNDFFALSDEDILEEPEPEDISDSSIFSAPYQTPPTPPTPSSTSSFYSKRRTSSIYADDVAKEGAIQVAQIAAKHKFDLVYIVNLWPEETPESVSPTYRSSMDFSSRSNSVRNSLLGPMEGPMVKTAPGMTGRLLAAYGLSNLSGPFRISATVQSKILKHEGWMEYRSDDAQDGEFARGYGHAFHTGMGRRGSANSSPRSSCTQDISLNDRGIVFAAYRYPTRDSRTVGCTKEELEALHADAEGLVDYLVAIHKSRRLRDPAILHTLIDEDDASSR
ncbi:hypothetical protein CCHL11_02080 [Colletotrichum chlorophyti]|uniref:Uncharacterized protein n=1 Tax=Colletotrichum chlorophyti TaxID=708187 RepID=A0A1Q8S6U2_9PEZI|nr:hypothetical protein CCHL11_02080 [Colletotrichum chlorophyti]